MMYLYSGKDCFRSHICRFIMLAKEAECQFKFVDERNYATDVAEMNPYNELPVLVDRDFVIYGELVLIEFLDERLPLPSLLPTDPISRARLRLMLYRFRRDWFAKIYLSEKLNKPLTDDYKKYIADGLTAMLPFFEERGKSDKQELDLDLVDFYMGPFLWRLNSYGIELAPKVQKVFKVYSDKIFAMDAFKRSITTEELRLRVKR